MKKVNYLCFLLIILLTSCLEQDNRLKVSNNTDSRVYIEFSRDSCFSNIKNKLENIHEDRYNSIYNAFIKYVEANDTTRIGLMRKDGWPKLLNSTDNKTIFFFIIQDSIVSKYGSKYVIKHNLCERKAYTLEELEKSNWVVTYP